MAIVDAQIEIFAFLQDMSNYEVRKGSLDKAQNGIEVSTVYTSDEGYETAIIDNAGVHPVERYSDIETAKKGHKKWLDFASSATTGTKFKN
ncbi:MAG: hypothetical protein DRO67_06430 [Candidatus Asgardarchaeum californiense]|nr:MAG: hypothetical protein DRO67_06430 [Candidatus Asgardarchaeum californiense]